ncbi:hypothetical protein BDF14DRAFT_1816937 [Spinellus fusiger]|nr:hypothetical protein BDF14DRAFT_1816937 [Spinellus fusiger]
MSSPTASIHDLDDAMTNKKRERAQSVEPNPTVVETEEKSLPVSVPKKTKRDDIPGASVTTLRHNLKEMSTSDSTGSPFHTPSTPGSIETDEHMKTLIEEDEESAERESEGSPEKNATVSSLPSDEKCTLNESAIQGAQQNTTTTTTTDTVLMNNNPEHISKVMALFGGKGDADDWSEFEQDNEKENPTTKTTPETTGKPKYTFGASSGFGSKGWAAAHQTAPVPQKTSFGATSVPVFGFSSSSTAIENASVPVKTAPSFGSFAKASASPFALAAASHNSNALSAFNDKKDSVGREDPEEEEEEEEESTDFSNALSTGGSTFGESGKPKVPIAKPTQVKTGEEDEKTVYQTKAKLLALDTVSNNWKERGTGTLHINRNNTYQEQLQTRLVMRTDSVYRVILNLALFPGMKVFIMQDKFVRFAGFEAGTHESGNVEPVLVNYALKVRDALAAQELCNQITLCIPQGSTPPAGR